MDEFASTSGTTSSGTASATLDEPIPGLTCETCNHPVALHDVIGLRFCAATLAGSLSRGCVCRGV
jgi:hypothetical protein